jgi:ribosomal protein S18 acetylase RimI-like enzyme
VTKINIPSIEIERAVPDDAEIICDIRDRAWLESYPNTELGITAEQIMLNAKGRNEEFVPRRIAHLKEQLAKDNKTGLTTYVAKIEGKVVGYIDPCIDEHGRRRIGAIYVALEAQRKGVGGKLMSHALNVLGRDQDIYLDVVSYNQNAIDFYKYFGFEKTSAIVPDDEEAPDYMVQLPNIEMVLRAASQIK